MVNSRSPVWIIKFLERDINKRFPGKGMVTLLAGILLTAIIFPHHLIPALLVVAVADGLSTIVGSTWGKKSLPWSKNKSWAGSISFFVVASVILYFFSNFWYVAALVLAFLESVDYRDIILLDDNLIVPLATGALLILL